MRCDVRFARASHKSLVERGNVVGRGCYQGAVGSGEPSDGTTGVAKPVRGRPEPVKADETTRGEVL